MGNGPKVIEYNDANSHQFRQVPVLVFCCAVVGSVLTLMRQQLRLATLSQTGPWCSPVEEPQDDAEHDTDQQRCRERDIKSEVVTLDDDITGQAANSCPGNQRPEQSGSQQRQPENDKKFGNRHVFLTPRNAFCMFQELHSAVAVLRN